MPRLTPALAVLVLVLASGAVLSAADVPSNDRSAAPKSAEVVTANTGLKNGSVHRHARPRFRRNRMVEKARARARARISAQQNAKTRLELAKAVNLIKP